MEFTDVTKCREMWTVFENKQQRLSHKISLVLSSKTVTFDPDLLFHLLVATKSLDSFSLRMKKNNLTD